MDCSQYSTTIFLEYKEYLDFHSGSWIQEPHPVALVISHFSHLCQPMYLSKEYELQMANMLMFKALAPYNSRLWIQRIASLQLLHSRTFYTSQKCRSISSLHDHYGITAEYPQPSLCFHFLIKFSKQSLTSLECFDLSRYISLQPVAESTNDKMYLYPKVTLGGNSPHKSECIRSPNTFGWNCCGISCKGRLRAPPRRQPSQCSCKCLAYRGVSGSPIERDRARFSSSLSAT